MIGLSRSPRSTIARSSASVSAKPPPWPPSVKAGRTTAGAGIGAELVDRGDDLRLRCPQPAALDGVPEQRPVLGPADHVDARADQLDAELVEDARLGELDREVERRLAAERRQERIGALAAEHVGDALDVERLDVGAVGEARVGHDRGRVRVDDDRAESVLAQDLQRLAAGVVELAGLADHDRAGADQADRRDIGAPRHQAGTRLSTQRSRIGQASCVPGPASGWNCTERAFELGEVEALDGAVVERDVASPPASSRRRNREAVVLARDEDAAGRRARAPGGWRRDGRTGACRSRGPSRARAAGARGRCRARSCARAGRGSPSTSSTSGSGSPGPFDSITPSKPARSSAPVTCGNTVTAAPACRRRRMIDVLAP